MISVLHVNVNYLVSALHQTMIEYLDKEVRNQVFVAIYDSLTQEYVKIKPNDNVLVSVCYKKADRFIFTLKQRKILKSLEEHLDVKEYDLVHAYTLFTDGNVALNLKKKYGKPYVVAVRDSDVNHFFKKAIHLRKRGIRIMREAEKVIFLSQPYQEEVLNSYVPKELREEIRRKSRIIPNGIQDSWFDNLYRERNVDEATKRFTQKELHAACVGVLTKRKNYAVTIEALRILQKRGWTVSLDVIGQPYEEKIVELVKETEFATYHGTQPFEKIKDFYRANDVFVMPSLTETFGLTYAEALTQTLPVIYSRGQGFDRQFPDGEIGFPVDPQSPEEVADRIEDICANYPQICSKCIEDSYKFQWETIVSTYCEIYADITGKAERG